MSPLKGLNRRVTTAGTFAVMIGVALAVTYAAFTAELHEGSRLAFALILAGVVGFALFIGDREEQARLKVVRGLGSGELPGTRENLMRASAELAAIPEVSFWVVLAFWAISPFAVGVLYALVPGVGWANSSRVAFIGLALGPLVSLLAHLLGLQRARIGLQQVAALGLSTADLVRAVPADRFALRRRLVIFAAVSVITPLVLVCDLLAITANALLERVIAAAGPAEQAAVIASLPAVGLAPLLIVAGLTIAVVIACGVLGGRVLGDPLQALADATQRFASGKLGRSSAVVVAEDELWAVSTAFAAMELQLLTAVGRLTDAGVKISSTTQELIASSGKHEAGAADQTGALSQTSATTEELARSAKQIAQNASDVSKLAQAMLDTAQGGKRSAGAFYASILRVREGNQAIADSVVRLNKRVQQVGRIVEFIDGIADKSDLLALNAELEGTKAGEVGRGFSLVAAEMRRLSESVMASTREINRLIEEIRDATNAAVMATEAGVKATDAGSALARQVTESFDRIVAFANQTTDAVKAITLATHQQQAGTDQLASAMSDILRSTQTALGATAQMSSANSDLSMLSSELQVTVSRFEVSK